MPFRISGFPSGLLSLLDAQNFGMAPKDMGDIIQPTVDLSVLFAASKQFGVGGFEVAPAVGGFIPMTGGTGPNTVPAGEIWLLRYTSVLVQCGVGETSNAAPAIRLNGLVTVLNELLAVAASQVRNVPSVAGNLILTAGTEIGAYCDANTGAPTLSTASIVSRLRV